MSTDEQRLILSLEARFSKYEREMQKAARVTDRNFQAMEHRAAVAASRMDRSLQAVGSRIGGGFKSFGVGALGTIAAGATLRNMQQLADKATSMRNALKVAGLSGDSLNQTFDRLYASAQRNAAPVESLVDLYSKLSLTQKELGVSSEDILGFVDGIGVALRAGGTDAKAASGALLQLSQALGGGVVRAEEFNSMLEGTPTIVKAAAKGIAEAEGSVAKLRNLVNDGKVSSRAFFEGFKAGSVELAQQVESSQLTVSQSFVQFENALLKVVGQFDDATGASKAFAGGITNLASAIDRFDMSGFISEIQRAKREFEGFLASAGNSDFFKWINGQLGVSAPEGLKLGDTLDPRPAKAASLEREIKISEQQLANIKQLGFDATALEAKLAVLRRELQDVWRNAGPNDMSVQPSVPAGTKPAAATPAPAVKPVSLKDHPVSGGATGSKEKIVVNLAPYLAKGKASTHVTGFDKDFSQNLQKMFNAMPAELAGQIRINSGFRSNERQAQLYAAALKKYGSEKEARRWVAPPGNSQHNHGEAADLGYGSDAARKWAHANASKFGLAFPLSNENWHIENADARGDRGAGMDGRPDYQAELEKAKGYIELVQASKDFTNQQALEQATLGVTAQKAAALKYEQQMLSEAQRAGIDVTPTQAAEIRKLAEAMGEAEAATLKAAQAQEKNKEAGRFFAESLTSGLSGILTGAQSAEQAVQNLANSLIDAALQAMLLGQGPLASLFGGGSGLLGAVFGLKSGGVVEAATGGHIRGPGTSTSDSIPARLSNGEFVINAKATRKHRALIEAINSDRVAAFSGGGLAGSSAPLAGQAGGAAPNISITVNAAQGGNPQQNAESARATAKAVENTVRGLVNDELRRQSRPGNQLGRRG